MDTLPEAAVPAPRQQHRASRRLLTPDEVRALSVRRPLVPLLHILVSWALILAAWTAAALGPWWMLLLAIPVIGTQYYALTIIGHDGVHRRLMRSRRINNLISDVCVYSAVGLITHINGRNHLRHHAGIGTHDDPDRYKYESRGRETKARLLLSFLPVRVLRNQVQNVVLEADVSRSEEGEGSSAASATAGYTPRDISILVVSQTLLIGGLTWVFGWWGWPLLWLLPVGIFMVGGDTLRSYCEHSFGDADEHHEGEEHRLISYHAGWLERTLLAPHNMNLHAAHHLYVAIPYYNLPAADRLLQERAAGTHLTWRRSYMEHVLSVFRQLPAKATPTSTSAP
jgi:fatty acid desaturase